MTAWLEVTLSEGDKSVVAVCDIERIEQCKIMRPDDDDKDVERRVAGSRIITRTGMIYVRDQFEELKESIGLQ